MSGYAYGRVVNLFATNDRRTVEVEVSEKMTLAEMRVCFEEHTGMKTNNIAVHMSWSKDMSMSKRAKLNEKRGSSSVKRNKETYNEAVSKPRRS